MNHTVIEIQNHDSQITDAYERSEWLSENEYDEEAAADDSCAEDEYSDY